MEQPDNPPEVVSEGFEEAVLGISNHCPEDLLQLIFDRTDPNNPLVSAVRRSGAMNNG